MVHFLFLFGIIYKSFCVLGSLSLSLNFDLTLVWSGLVRNYINRDRINRVNSGINSLIL